MLPEANESGKWIGKIGLTSGIIDLKKAEQDLLT
jgi:hypothetical protein